MEDEVVVSDDMIIEARDVHPELPHLIKSEIHRKSWGHEEWIVNGDLYCGKRLVFTSAGGRTSLHFHAKKHETMWCRLGGFTITVVDTRDATRSDFRLKPGDTLVIPPFSVHRIVALYDDSELMEFSTHHEDSDSYRVEK